MTAWENENVKLTKYVRKDVLGFLIQNGMSKFRKRLGEVDAGEPATSIKRVEIAVATNFGEVSEENVFGQDISDVSEEEVSEKNSEDLEVRSNTLQTVHDVDEALHVSEKIL